MKDDLKEYLIEKLTQLKIKAEFEDRSRGKIYIPNGRINFESGLGKKGKSPAFGSVVMRIQDKWEIEFIDINLIKGVK